MHIYLGKNYILILLVFAMTFYFLSFLKEYNTILQNANDILITKGISHNVIPANKTSAKIKDEIQRFMQDDIVENEYNTSEIYTIQDNFIQKRNNDRNPYHITNCVTGKVLLTYKMDKTTEPLNVNDVNSFQKESSQLRSLSFQNIFRKRSWGTNPKEGMIASGKVNHTSFTLLNAQ